MNKRSPHKRNKRTAPRSPAPQGGGKRRLILLLFALLIAVGGAWRFGALSAVPLRLARHALERRDPEGTRHWLRFAERLHPPGGSAEVEWMRARLHRRSGNYRSMNRRLERAAALGADPERIRRERMLAAAQAGQLRDVEQDLLEWLPDSGLEGAEISDAYSNGLAAEGRLTEATTLLDAWEADYPDDPAANLRRGRIAEHTLKWDEAEREYRRALEKAPHDPPALYALGRLLLDRKRPKEALPLFRECARQAPVAAAAADIGAARCLRLLGRSEEARRLLEGVLAMDASQREKAHDRVRHAAEGDRTAFELGKLESAEGKYERAERWLRQAVVANPRDLDARYALGVALQRLGKEDEAQQELEHVSRVRKDMAEVDKLYNVVASDPGNVEAHYKIGLAFLKHRSQRVGVYWLRSALAHDPQYAPAHRALADYFASQAEDGDNYEGLANYHREMAESAGPEENE